MSDVLLIGDPHFKVSNLCDIDLFTTYTLDIIRARRPHNVVILGDVLHDHEKLHTTALNRALSFFRAILENGCMLFILVGNHDMISQHQFLTDKHWMNAIKRWDNVCVVDKPIIAKMGSANVAMCPYVPNGRFIEALSTIGDEWRKCRMIFAHQEFKGCKMGHIVSTEGDVWSEEYPPIISGHIHDYQKINNVFYPGSAIQHSFGDSSKRVLPYLTFMGQTYEIEEIKLQLPIKKTIYKSVDELSQYEFSGDKNNARIVVKDAKEKLESFKKSSVFKNLKSSGVNVVLKEDVNHLVVKLYNGETEFRSIFKNMIHETGDETLARLSKILIH